MQLTTARLTLRRWRRQDREPFAQMNADPQVMRHFPARLTRAESDRLADNIQQHFADYGYGLWAVELTATGAFIGFLGLAHPAFQAPFTPCTEIGWRLAARYWGQGLATEGGTAVVTHAFQRLGLLELLAFTVPANHRSRRVMQKLGFTHHPADDFYHPRLPAGHPLRPHVLYRLRRENWVCYPERTHHA